jgi:hypothetical protein
VDVLASGHERPPGDGDFARSVRRGRYGARPDPRTARWRRPARAAAVLLLAAAATSALRAGADPVERRPRTAAETYDGGPPIVPSQPLPTPSRSPSPPFDHLPGRTPIPEPWITVDEGRLVVRGLLPPTGAGPGARPAEAAARLVLGRYCRAPGGYEVRLRDGGGWRTPTAVVMRPVPLRATRMQMTTIRLRWAGDAYAWQGSGAELAHCA